MKHVDLFSGIGGFALAASWVWGDEYENIGHSEIEPFPCKVYHKHFPGSRCLGDITKIDWSEFEGRIDLITGGFPCQPFSVAGKRRGKEDDRFLWYEMLRAIQDVRPRWVLAENVSGIESMALDEVLSSLEDEGYTNCEGKTKIAPFIIPACAVNAPHRRDRVWIVAQNSINARNRGRHNGNPRGGERALQTQGSDSKSKYAANDTAIDGLPIGNPEGQHEWVARLSQEQSGATFRRSDSNSHTTDWGQGWFEVATRLCRMDDGVSNRVDRLKGLGNAIVPQVAEVIMRAIKDQCDPTPNGGK